MSLPLIEVMSRSAQMGEILFVASTSRNPCRGAALAVITKGSWVNLAVLLRDLASLDLFPSNGSQPIHGSAQI
jgi:hypothetical protein